MTISEDTDYDEMASMYQSLEIARLNEILKQHGITEYEQRKAICAAYFSASGEFFDRGWFRYPPWFGDRKFYPQLCFAEKRPRSEWQAGHIGELETLYVPREGFAFSDVDGGDYTNGNLYWVFEDCNEDIHELEQGID